MATALAFFSNSKDANGYKSHSNYVTAQTAATATAVASVGTSVWLGQELRVTTYFVGRVGLWFDTSGLPDLASITAATLSLRGYESQAGLPETDFNITIVSGTDLSDSGFALADYGDLLDDTTSMGSLSTTGWSTSGYNDITLNATGLAAISKTGITKLALRSSLDISATAPTGDDTIDFYTFEQGIGYRPRLIVYYNLMLPGNISIIETNFHYIDEYGQERYIQGTPVV